MKNYVGNLVVGRIDSILFLPLNLGGITLTLVKNSGSLEEPGLGGKPPNPLLTKAPVGNGVPT